MKSCKLNFRNIQCTQYAVNLICFSFLHNRQESITLILADFFYPFLDTYYFVLKVMIRIVQVLNVYSSLEVM